MTHSSRNSYAATFPSLNPQKAAILKLFLLAALVACLAAALSPHAAAQSGEWTWVGGSNTANSAGIYGTKGTPDTGNIPGARYYPTTWTDASGNFWLFGGFARDSAGALGIMNDLWEFDPVAKTWTYVSGTETLGGNFYIPGSYGLLGLPDPASMPGGRLGAASWIDGGGNLWLFGGDGAFNNNFSAGELNDLWEFTPSTGLWTWQGGGNDPPVTGPNPSIPAGRYGAFHWTDAAGNFWLFGGQSAQIGGPFSTTCPNCQMDDLWQFNPSTTTWTLEAGSPTGAQAGGKYGILGFDNAANYPGNRAAGNVFTDTSGKPWIYAGLGLDQTTDPAYNNDFFRYNGSDGQWAWMGGSNLATQFSVDTVNGTATTYFGNGSFFDVEGLPSANALPGGRDVTSSWTDSNQNFWIFAGDAFDSTGSFGFINELWEFNQLTREWTWMGGSDTIGSTGATPGVYGTLNNPDPGNIPPGRGGSASWTDASGNFWLFGGGSASGSTSLLLGDLWEFTPPPAAGTPSFDLSAGSYPTAQVVHLTSATPGATIYYTVDGKQPVTNSPVYTDHIDVTSPVTIKAIAVASGLSISAMSTSAYNVTPPAPTPLITPASGTYSVKQNIHISDSLAGTFLYYTTDGSTPIPGNPGTTQYTASFYVTANSTVNAVAIKPGSATQSLTASNTYTIAAQALNPKILPFSGTFFVPQTVTITDATPGAIIYYTTDNSTPTTGSAVYTTPITVSSTSTVQAVAIAPGGSLSNVTANNYTITTAPPAPQPVITPAPGTYATKQNIHLSDSVTGVKMYYTTDGSDPTTGSTLYTASFYVTAGTTTIKVIAIKPGVLSQSPTAASTYTITH